MTSMLPLRFVTSISPATRFRFTLPFRVLRTRLDFAPALPVQGAIDDRVMDRVTQSRLVGLSDRSRNDKLTLLRSGEKGHQQFLFFFAREMGMITATVRLVA